MLCLGIDPDLHGTAIASWDDAGPVAAHVVSVPRKLTGTDALLAMMHELSKPWPDMSRGATGTVGTFTLSYGDQTTKPIAFDGCGPELPDWCAVEGQELARTGAKRHARPEDIVRLGNVAGMCVMRVARGYLHGCGLYWPKPSEWKGSVPKHAMQARLYDELGWGFQIVLQGKMPQYAVPLHAPVGFAEIGTAPWKHCGDALLLARWCWEQAQGRKWTRPA